MTSIGNWCAELLDRLHLGYGRSDWVPEGLDRQYRDGLFLDPGCKSNAVVNLEATNELLEALSHLRQIVSRGYRLLDLGAHLFGAR